MNTISEENKKGHRRISRKLLASIGMAGVAFATVGILGREKAFSASGANSNDATHAAYEGGEFGLMKDCVKTTAIDDLRATLVQDAPGIYYVTDPGLEGVFAYDPVDTATLDNNGTVIVSADMT